MAIGTGVRPDSRGRGYGRSAGAWRSTNGRPAIDRRAERNRAGADKGVGQEWMGWVSEGRVIPYLPGLGKEVGSVYAALLLQQVVYRWVRNNEQPFYKFKGPCGHRLYRPGDSWTEELGVGRRDFDNALRRIAVRKTAGMTPQEAMAAGTPVVYWHTGDRRMFFTVNPAGLAALLGRLRDSQRASEEGSPEDADDWSDEMAWEADEPSAGPGAEGDAGAERIAVEIGFGQRAPAAESAGGTSRLAAEVGFGRRGLAAESDSSAGSLGAEGGLSRRVLAAESDSSAGRPEAECDPSRGVVAAESAGSTSRLAAVGGFGQRVLAAESDSSAGRPGAECDPSRRVLTAEGDSSTGRLEAEGDCSRGGLTAEGDSSRGVLTAEGDSSTRRLEAECDSSSRGLESEIGSSKGHLAAVCAATSTEKTTKTSQSGRDAVFYSDWDALKRVLKLGMLAATCDQVRRDLACRAQDGRLTICGPPKALEWLNRRYRPTIERTPRHLARPDGLLAPAVQFVACGPGRPAAGKAGGAHQVRASTRESISIASITAAWCRLPRPLTGAAFRAKMRLSCCPTAGAGRQ